MVVKISILDVLRSLVEEEVYSLIKCFNDNEFKEVIFGLMLILSVFVILEFVVKFVILNDFCIQVVDDLFG